MTPRSGSRGLTAALLLGLLVAAAWSPLAFVPGPTTQLRHGSHLVGMGQQASIAVASAVMASWEALPAEAMVGVDKERMKNSVLMPTWDERMADLQDTPWIAVFSILGLIPNIFVGVVVFTLVKKFLDEGGGWNRSD
eukprot:CAMPEP_0203967952 /NCGR_PEP_ID=MMETSP0359-20131031/96704_1 /ASSEMBLY_ACC=CAM_ASM_000338 /TAXON_ID=268821 /ORGANISM="Scrippsiella Hangoei, Strain SHTV-5" /LENGTH=136 /DNA_ID=CAMNT_0050905871 /DNA_START=66 /DNA_END=476 /DNA_ORIENTATION=-